MIFRSKKGSNFDTSAVTSIIDHVELNDFLFKGAVKKDILTCPTNAIDIEQKEITKECIDCGICWLTHRNLIEKIGSNDDLLIFKKYLKKDKMFIYKWLSLCLQDESGINIKSNGFSRVKKIPLLVRSKDYLYIIKSVHEHADIEKADYELDDIIGLITHETKKYNVKKIIIVIGGIDQKYKTESYVISFDELYNLIIEKNIRKISEIVK